MDLRRQWHPTPVLLPGKSHGWRSLVGCGLWGREESDMIERLHFHFPLHALEREMATHSSGLAWRIPGTGEPGGLTSMGSHRVGHDWSDLAAAVLPMVRYISKFYAKKIAWANLMRKWTWLQFARIIMLKARGSRTESGYGQKNEGWLESWKHI